MRRGPSGSVPTSGGVAPERAATVARRRHKASGSRPAEEPERPFSAREQALLFGDQPELSGSPSWAFTYGLYCQAVRSLCHNAQDDAGTVHVARVAVRRALAGIGPRDPLEGMMAAQLVGLHDAAMECLRRGAMAAQPGEFRDANLTQANKLVRSYAALVEALDRHRGAGRPQVVRVARVTVEAGGRAIVGTVTRGGGDGAGSDGRPHAKALADASEPALRGADPGREPVPVAGGEGEAAV